MIARVMVRFCFVISMCLGIAPTQVAADPFPPGPYLVNSGNLTFGEGCQPVTMSHGTLTASCLNYFGARNNTVLANADKCVEDRHIIEDVNGLLRCVISQTPIGGSYPYISDIISETVDQRPNFGTIKTYRIDQPRVDVPQDQFPHISFRPGDKITISAGGCAQTGGSGKTWKSYVYPTGSSADVLYSGLLWIPGVTGGGLQRIAGTINRTYTVPASLPPQLANQLYLRTGYQDDGYGDNGYYSHDNGNNDQCANVGPAWIEIRVVSAVSSPPKPVGVKWAPWSRAFDLTWNVNVAGDDNGLPLNPQWGFQVNKPGGTPDFSTICGTAISSGDSINDTVLNNTCTTQLPTADIYTGVFRGVDGLCSGLIDGHLNWALATYTGNVQWRAYSGGWPEDGDYNFGLLTPNNVVETAQTEGPDSGVGLEFNSGETINNFVSPWWAAFRNDDDAAKSNAVDGDLAVVTGLVGIDGVHGGYVEIHPVFAMAILTGEAKSGDGVDETWQFFIRNAGSEGECSELSHQWPGLNGGYAIQVPWPKDATQVKVVQSGTEFWVSSSSFQAPNFEGQAPWTYLEFQIPPNVTDAEEGHFTLHYALKNGAKPAVRRKTMEARVRREEEPEWPDLSDKFTDATERTQFFAELQAAARPASPRPHSIRAAFNAHISAHRIRSDASRAGRLTHSVTTEDVGKRAENERLRAIYEAYADRFKNR